MKAAVHCSSRTLCDWLDLSISCVAVLRGGPLSVVCFRATCWRRGTRGKTGPSAGSCCDPTPSPTTWARTWQRRKETSCWMETAVLRSAAHPWLKTLISDPPGHKPWVILNSMTLYARIALLLEAFHMVWWIIRGQTCYRIKSGYGNRVAYGTFYCTKLYT